MTAGAVTALRHGAAAKMAKVSEMYDVTWEGNAAHSRRSPPGARAVSGPTGPRPRGGGGAPGDPERSGPGPAPGGRTQARGTAVRGGGSGGRPALLGLWATGPQKQRPAFRPSVPTRPPPVSGGPASPRRRSPGKDPAPQGTAAASASLLSPPGYSAYQQKWSLDRVSS